MDIEYFLKEYLVPDGKYYSKKNYCSFEPGTDFEYSNIALTLLAHIIENITGTKLEEYSKEYIFKLANMQNTSWNFSNYDKNTVALPYSNNFLGYRSLGYYSFPIYPAYDLKSTPEDLSNFFITFFKTEKFISKESKKIMLEIQKGIIPKYWNNMGLIWQYKNIDGYDFVGHTGGLFGIGALAFHNYDKDRTVIMLINSSWKTGKSYDRFKDEPMKEIFYKLMEY